MHSLRVHDLSFAAVHPVSSPPPLLQPLLASLWHTPRKHRCVWAYPDGGVADAEGSQPTRRLHAGHPPVMRNLF